MMNITAPQPAHIDTLHAIYRAAVADAPHCRFAPDAARFRDELLGVAPPAPLFRGPSERRMFVAEEDGMARGFASFIRFTDWDGVEHQAVTALFCAGETAGRALLGACEAAAGPGTLEAFPQSHGKSPLSEYNGGWDGLPDRVPDVARILARAGYAPFYRELHMTLDLRRFPPAPAALPAGLELRVEPLEGRIRLRTLDGEVEMASLGFGTLAPLAADPRAARTGYIWWLEVEEGYRRRGIARALMAEALAQLVDLGCEECWLTTAADNWPAQPLYLALGFAAVDCSTSFRKR
ncbi:MAG TPA: GNAT family N-acetyltransferase [Roseiflexaceae bacterium]|nr:GNAT family N-acetyltransferase [Roseiflexaceae bacterium]